jgi:hypothetical protein
VEELRQGLEAELQRETSGDTPALVGVAAHAVEPKVPAPSLPMYMYLDIMKPFPLPVDPFLASLQKHRRGKCKTTFPYRSNNEVKILQGCRCTTIRKLIFGQRVEILHHSRVVFTSNFIYFFFSVFIYFSKSFRLQFLRSKRGESSELSEMDFPLTGYEQIWGNCNILFNAR